MAIIIVLGLLAIAMAVSYAMLRSQVMSAQIQQNWGRQIDARQAAAAGLSVALRKISQTDWEGVDVALTGRLSDTETFRVTFSTGDASLAPGDPDYDQYPYRLTITSTGYAASPANPAVRGEHQVRAVVQLVRRAMPEPPPNWNELQQYTVYQWSRDNSRVQGPVHVQGPVRLAGQLRLCRDYPAYPAARARYLADLEAMRAGGQPDNRPLSGRVDLPFPRNTSSTLVLLRTCLRLPTRNVPPPRSAPLDPPSVVSSYQLFPGGKRYAVPNLQQQYGSTLSDQTLGPDPIDNPLGIFWTDGDLYLRGNVTIRGTLIGPRRRGDINIVGDRVRLEAVDLPPLAGSSRRVQLPVLIHRADLRVHRGTSGGMLRGMAVVWDTFQFERGAGAMSFQVRGRLVVATLQLDGRSIWELDRSRWRQLLNAFLDQRNDSTITNPIAYFPQWLEEHLGLPPQAPLTIRPDSSRVTYHWQNWDSPIFVPHPDDDGLRWDLIDWQDNL